jgi:hypothetical protein
MPHGNFYLPERQDNGLRSVAQQAGLSYSELLRRMVDQCLQTTTLNVIVPAMSGKIQVELLK